MTRENAAAGERDGELFDSGVQPLRSSYDARADVVTRPASGDDRGGRPRAGSGTSCSGYRTSRRCADARAIHLRFDCADAHAQRPSLT